MYSPVRNKGKGVGGWVGAGPKDNLNINKRGAGGVQIRKGVRQKIQKLISRGDYYLELDSNNYVAPLMGNNAERTNKRNKN